MSDFGDVDARTLQSRFPALARLGEALRRREIPFVPQTTVHDCGAASLVMVLGYHGREVRVEEVRAAMGLGRGGIRARSILDTASVYQLRGRAVRIELEDLSELPPASILHWNLRHYVVLERVVGDDVFILDPAIGRRRVPMSEVSDSFSGVALLFEKGDGFETHKLADRPIRRYAVRALKQSNDWVRIIVASLTLQVFATALPFINGRLVDRVVPRGDYELLLVLIACFSFVVIFQFVTRLVRSRMLLYLRTRIDASMTLGFLDHMLRLPYAFFQSRQTADLIIRVNSISAIRDVLTSSLLSAMLDGTLVFGYLVLLVAISPKLFLMALAVVIVQSSTYVFTRRKLRELAAANIAKQAEASSYLTETLAGIETLKSLGSESHASQAWSNLYVDLLNNNLNRGVVANWSDATLGTLRLVSPFLLLITGIMEVMNGAMTLGVMLSANAFAIGFVEPVSNLISNFTALQFVAIQLSRVEDVLATPPEQYREDNRPIQVAPRLSGRIDLKDVTFRYSPTLPLVVKNVTLSIQPGQMVALVGPSGSGKSTLASLLLGLYEPTDGNVVYDGISLSELDLRSVRRQLGVVVQRSWIFGCSIKENIALTDPEISMDKIKDAARLACIHDDIEAMPMGYDTVVSSGGGSISGGQRQRLALARALVNDPAVLLLDEATSSLDALTERRIQGHLEDLGCTRIIVAHRLSTIVAADVILVMKDGRIVESGTHEELLSRNGVYRDLVRPQDALASVEHERFPESSPTLITSPPSFGPARRARRGQA